MSFTFKIDWYEFKKTGLPSNELNQQIKSNEIKSALSQMVDVVRDFNRDKADGAPTIKLKYLLAPDLICNCCGCHPCYEDSILEDNYGEHSVLQ